VPDPLFKVHHNAALLTQNSQLPMFSKCGSCFY